MKLLHVADVHLGVKALAFGQNADDLRARIQAAFDNTLQLAVEEQCDAILIAGDLFDTNRVGQSTLSAAIASLRRVLAAAPSLHIILIPGNHDCLGGDSIYNAAEFASLGGRFHLLTNPSGETVFLPHIDAAFHGAPITAEFRQLDINPLTNLTPDAGARWNIALVHAGIGELARMGPDAPVITQADIAASGMDYVALGHYHNWPACDSGGVMARYPGSPELIGIKNPEGHALIVEFTDAGVLATERSVATLHLRQLTVAAPETHSQADLMARVSQQAAADVCLKAEVAGLLQAGVRLDIPGVEDELRAGFYYLEISDDTAVGLDEISDMPEELVIGRFARIMRERIEDARARHDEKQLEIATEALRIGLHVLRGGEL